MTKRLEILKSSLEKKQAKFDDKLEAHFKDVKRANGQPLNDKRDGHVTLKRWDKQNDSLNNTLASIEKTKNAIEKEQDKIEHVEAFNIPEYLQSFIDSGKIKQWRKHPRFFFVEGVDKARICVMENGKIGHRYLKSITSKEQYAIFRDVHNAIRAIESKG